jgi:hypothetical protein
VSRAGVASAPAPLGARACRQQVWGKDAAVASESHGAHARHLVRVALRHRGHARLAHLESAAALRSDARAALAQQRRAAAAAEGLLRADAQRCTAAAHGRELAARGGEKGRELAAPGEEKRRVGAERLRLRGAKEARMGPWDLDSDGPVGPRLGWARGTSTRMGPWGRQPWVRQRAGWRNFDDGAVDLVWITAAWSAIGLVTVPMADPGGCHLVGGLHQMAGTGRQGTAVWWPLLEACWLLLTPGGEDTP